MGRYQISEETDATENSACPSGNSSIALFVYFLFRTVLIENLRSLIKSSTDRFQREVRTYLGCGEIKVGSLECGKNRERVFFRGGVLVLTKFSGHI